MAKFILKFERGDAAWYLEWSTIVDAPVTYGMTLDEFRKYYLEEYGRDGMRGLDARLERVEATGTSCQMGVETAETAIICNMLGDDGEALTYDEIVDRYCVAPAAKAARAEVIRDVIRAQEAQKADREGGR